ncbi:unnamed protein product [Tetraodon nigroviridis]|uniref:(spotted green pufferfish) hypothetical protein n=1 Tax=Tetraodon nigroviridis TaxID=99883 RepID=Q4S4U1_TETNG|nr:unnamed protein product [Tetraodon nigroviridis]
MVSRLDSTCSLRCWAESLDNISMSSLLNLSTLGRICGSSNDVVVLDRVKRKNSVRRMSIIEDGELAEVLYLIPKQSIMEQLPFLNPSDYILCEKLASIPAQMSVLHTQDGCLRSPSSERRVIHCFKCGELCRGQVLRVQANHFHVKCFTCKEPVSLCVGAVCGCDMAQSGFFIRNGDYLCPLDFQRLHGTPCNNCREFVEGEVVTVLGKTYHPACFVCNICKDGVPYCERDYQNKFGIQCDACQKFITGKVLEAGVKHYHPTCARCSQCGKLFTEGDEMYLQGSAVWHPHCRNSSRTEDSYRASRPKTPCLDHFFPSHKLKSIRSSSESSCSRPSSCTPGSPSRTISAKVDNEIIDYRDLAAIPRVKAIFDIEHPDMISYETVNGSSSTLEKRRNRQDSQSVVKESFDERKCIPKSTSHGSFGVNAMYSRHSYTPSLSRSPQHFHRPDDGFNMYRKPPIYKQQELKSSTSQTTSLPGYGRNGLGPVGCLTAAFLFLSR